MERGSPARLAHTCSLGVKGQGNSDCALASKSVHQHLGQTDLHCLELVEGMRSPSQLGTHQYMGTGPDLAKVEIDALQGESSRWSPTIDPVGLD